MSLLSILPNLSEKQKIAMDLAIKSGYYDFPKKIRLVELAKEMRIAYSTFQAHLKKAEQKLIPYVFKRANYHMETKTNKDQLEKKIIWQ